MAYFVEFSREAIADLRSTRSYYSRANFAESSLVVG
jgi:hypothetical protein